MMNIYQESEKSTEYCNKMQHMCSRLVRVLVKNSQLPILCQSFKKKLIKK